MVPAHSLDLTANDFDLSSYLTERQAHTLQYPETLHEAMR